MVMGGEPARVADGRQGIEQTAESQAGEDYRNQIKLCLPRLVDRVYEEEGGEQHEHADRSQKDEQSAPGPMLQNETGQGGTHGGAQGHDQADHPQRQSATLGREKQEHHILDEGHERACCGGLDDPARQQEREMPCGKDADQGTQQKNGHHGHIGGSGLKAGEYPSRYGDHQAHDQQIGSAEPLGRGLGDCEIFHDGWQRIVQEGLGHQREKGPGKQDGHHPSAFAVPACFGSASTVCACPHADHASPPCLLISLILSMTRLSSASRVCRSRTLNPLRAMPVVVSRARRIRLSC